METSETSFELFTKAIGDKLREVTGLRDIYYERSKFAGFPRISYTATVWTSDTALRGTLTCTISGNTLPSEVDHIAHTLIDELEGYSYCSGDLTYYLYNCRSAPSDDADKSVHIRILTIEFFAMGG